MYYSHFIDKTASRSQILDGRAGIIIFLEFYNQKNMYQMVLGHFIPHSKKNLTNHKCVANKLLGAMLEQKPALQSENVKDLFSSGKAQSKEMIQVLHIRVKM